MFFCCCFVLIPAEAHADAAALGPEAVRASLWVAEQRLKEAPPSRTAQAAWDNQGNESSRHPASPPGKGNKKTKLFPLLILIDIVL